MEKVNMSLACLSARGMTEWVIGGICIILHDPVLDCANLSIDLFNSVSTIIFRTVRLSMVDEYHHHHLHLWDVSFSHRH